MLASALQVRFGPNLSKPKNLSKRILKPQAHLPGYSGGPCVGPCSEASRRAARRRRCCRQGAGRSNLLPTSDPLASWASTGLSTEGARSIQGVKHRRRSSFCLLCHTCSNNVAAWSGLNCFFPEIFSYFGKYLYCRSLSFAGASNVQEYASKVTQLKANWTTSSQLATPMNSGFQFAPESTMAERTFECPFLEEERHRHAMRVVMVLVFVMASYIWISLSLPKKAGYSRERGGFTQAVLGRIGAEGMKKLFACTCVVRT